MEILIAGASGFIGRHLVPILRKKGHNVHTLGRKDLGDDAIKEMVKGKDAIINLMGESISGRWTKSKKKRILASRINTTKSLIEAIADAEENPEVFIQASAVGIYDDNHRHDEKSHYFAEDFLAEVVKDWENTAESIKGKTEATRLIIIRMGIVLGKDGGMIKKLMMPYRLRIGVQPGRGRHICPFIHIKDLTHAIAFLLEHKNIAGIVNGVSPERVTCAHLHTLIVQMLKPLWKFTIPDLVLSLIFGEGANPMLKGQEVVPGVLEEKGFSFQYAALEEALADILYKTEK